MESRPGSREILFERIYEGNYRDRNAEELQLRLRFAKPEYVEDKDFWACEIQVTGIGDEKWRRAVGEDSLQAFLLAIRVADALLTYLGDNENIKITWFEDDDLGLIGGAST